MDDRIGKYWWVMLIQGIASIVYAVLAMSWPALTIVVLISIYAAFTIFYGVSGIFRSFSIRKTNPLWWLGLLNGIFALVAGILVYSYPGLTALLLAYFIAAWALITGISHLIQAFDKTYESVIRTAYGVAGVASVLFAILLFAMGPGRGIIALVWLLGAHAFVLGIVRIVSSFRLRSVNKQLSQA